MEVIVTGVSHILTCMRDRKNGLKGYIFHGGGISVYSVWCQTEEQRRFYFNIIKYNMQWNFNALFCALYFSWSLYAISVNRQQANSYSTQIAQDQSHRSPRGQSGLLRGFCNCRYSSNAVIVCNGILNLLFTTRSCKLSNSYQRKTIIVSKIWVEMSAANK